MKFQENSVSGQSLKRFIAMCDNDVLLNTIMRLGVAHECDGQTDRQTGRHNGAKSKEREHCFYII